ncbi:serine/arginine-rich splicing factor RS2Z32-like [Ooceraea biroi]|uniref:serine/arginine-rich splicing factor RS2Z32-like n=1 Tax=Ooceraea biroi TaxID=2015173 RepID=UPI000F091C1C|nr:serine/arginine-rich splicing factor RS2Z32-like [Ooceraea biroi]
MSGIFDHRPNKLALRKEFENRLWRKDESFCDYVFEKTTLANRITVDPEELIDLMIDGIPDTRLRDQARMNRYERVEDLLDAFKKITLYEQPRSDRDHRTVKKPSSVKPTAGADATRPKEARCFNCNEVGHAKRDCTKPQREWGSCYCCGSLEHHSRNCTQSRPTASTVPTQGTSRSTETSTHLIQPTRPE